MADKKERFVRIYRQGGVLTEQMDIWVDTVTGVNYLTSTGGYGRSLTPLLDRDGKPVVSPLPLRED
ncbi:MAG: xylan 1,4-beta-xylosidase [Oscillospiraceae bacterium]|jgi:hypothetical protein|nr:xylan 1,4-beta-xylosidase [Oscillospiraceae bacterium]